MGLGSWWTFRASQCLLAFQVFDEAWVSVMMGLKRSQLSKILTTLDRLDNRLPPGKPVGPDSSSRQTCPLLDGLTCSSNSYRSCYSPNSRPNCRSPKSFFVFPRDPTDGQNISAVTLIEAARSPVPRSGCRPTQCARTKTGIWTMPFR